MDNNNIYYYCKCYHFNDEFILCDERNKWINDVEETIEKHLNEFRPVFHMLEDGRTIRRIKIKKICLYQCSL